MLTTAMVIIYSMLNDFFKRQRVSLVVKEVFAQGESATEISTSNLLGSPSQRIDQIDQIDLPIQDSTGSDSLNLNNFVFTTVNGDTNDVDAGYISAYKLDKEKILVVLKAAGSIHSSIVHIRLDEENGCSENISIDALKIYERKSEHSHNISLVVCTSTINGESFHLWRIDINHLPLKCLESFSLFDLNSLPRLELPGSKKSFASYKYGPIGILSPATAVFVEGTRGLVLILDRSNKMVVVDIETEEDTSEAASDFSE